MKKLILTLALVGVSAVAFGQGTVNIENDLHVVQLTTDTSKLLAADVAWAGQPIPVDLGTGGFIPSGKSIVVGLYGGTTSTSLSLLTTLPLSADANSFTDGVISPNGFTLPTGFPGGTAAFFSFAAWDGAFATPFLAAANGSYAGDSGVFTVTPSSGTTLPASIQTASWTGGPVVLTAVVPEPSTFALAGLGAAALLIFRRRK